MSSSSSILERWLDAVLATPGLTALRDRDEARRVLLDDSLAGAELVGGLEGPLVDVGSGGGAPGIPLAAALPEREVTLLEANGRKAEFLRGWEREFPNVRVIDKVGNGVPNVSVNFVRLDSFSVFTNVSTQTDADGIATAGLWLLPVGVPGPFQIQAIPGGPALENAPLTLTAVP